MGIKVTVISPGKNRVSINNNKANKDVRATVPGIFVNQGGGGNGASELSQLTDVDASNPVDGDTLIYDSITGKYVVRPINGGTF